MIVSRQGMTHDILLFTLFDVTVERGLSQSGSGTA
jgi:hypothetical protein